MLGAKIQELERRLEETELGKYQLQSILGEGGMGLVYRAYDPHLARAVAIKTIRRSLLEGKSGHELRDRFRREARAEGKLIHQNIITIYEYHEDSEGTPFFVMEYVEGKDLKQYLSKGIRFNLEKSLNIVEQILRALAFSHKNGIVHRDIKPANIILLEDGTIKIADFGIAKMEESEYTRTGMILGTPQYSSPEQQFGGMVDARTDLYSTGAVLYELITGKKALSVVNSRKGKRKIRSDISYHSDDPKADRILSQVVAKAMSQDADDRFHTADEFLQALQQARPTPESNGRRLLPGLLIGLSSGLALLTAAYFLLPNHLLPDRVEPELSQTASTPTSTQPATELTQEQKEQVEQYLKVANIHLLVGRLSYPAGSNATESYEHALEIDPTNTTALGGLKEIRGKLTEKISRYLEEGNIEDAKIELDIALQHFPNDQSLRALQTQF